MAGVDEESPLLRPAAESQAQQNTSRKAKRSDILVIYGTFLGVFIASADESLVISTYSSIASQFQRLSEGSWLLVAYNFGYCISLPVYGVLSDTYGRKNVLLASYALFTLACLACGASSSITQLVLARVLAGSSGAGMIALVSIIITDLLPSSEVALYRGYENAVNVVGRSLGAPIGGLLIETVGWRWSFIGQVPFIVFCIIFATYGLPSSLNDTGDRQDSSGDDDEPSTGLGVLDFDFFGLILFSTTVLLLLFYLQELGTANDTTYRTYLLGATFLCAGTGFVLIELYWARRPLIPVRLLTQNLGAYCLVQVLLLGGRFALVSNIAPYFIRVENASDFIAGMSYVVVAVGVSMGSLVSGFLIKRTKRIKCMNIAAVLLCLVTYFLISVQWRNGFALWESVCLFLLGFGPGVLFPSMFVGMASSAPQRSLSTCIGTYYLSQQLGLIIGPASGSALSQGLFEHNLWERLGDIPGKIEVIGKVINEVRFANTLPPAVQEIIRSSYLDSFSSLPLFAMATTSLILPVLVLLKEARLE